MPSADGAIGGTPATGHQGDVADTERFRKLPDKPDIAFEKKRAKRLLREAHAGDAAALTCIARVAGGVPPAQFTLSLAQLAVARNYGFSSWAKLTQYFTRWAVLQSAGGQAQVVLSYKEAFATAIRNGQAKGLEYYAQTIATYLPRLYGKTNGEVFASPITPDEARFIAARVNGFANWAEVERRAVPAPFAGMTPDEQKAAGQARMHEHESSPRGRLHAAIRAVDVAAVRELVAAHPHLRQRPSEGPNYVAMFWGDAMRVAMEHRSPEADAILELFRWEGGGSQYELDRMLAHNCRSAGAVEWLMARGANPDRIWPNNITTLEHALIWYNLQQSRPSAVDALVRHVARIPQAMWIAAGLGDADAVAGYFDRRGRLTAAARRQRLDMTQFTHGGGPFNPDADDETILFDVASVAALNARTNVLEMLLGCGFCVDAAPYNATLLHSAVGCGSDISVEFLLSRGANPDCKQLWNRSPRWLAREIATVDMRGIPERDRVHALVAAAPPGPEAEARPTRR